MQSHSLVQPIKLEDLLIDIEDINQCLYASIMGDSFNVEVVCAKIRAHTQTLEKSSSYFKDVKDLPKCLSKETLNQYFNILSLVCHNCELPCEELNTLLSLCNAAHQFADVCKHPSKTSFSTLAAQFEIELTFESDEEIPLEKKIKNKENLEMMCQSRKLSKTDKFYALALLIQIHLLNKDVQTARPLLNKLIDAWDLLLIQEAKDTALVNAGKMNKNDEYNAFFYIRFNLIRQFYDVLSLFIELEREHHHYASALALNNIALRAVQSRLNVAQEFEYLHQRMQILLYEKGELLDDIKHADDDVEVQLKSALCSIWKISQATSEEALELILKAEDSLKSCATTYNHPDCTPEFKLHYSCIETYIGLCRSPELSKSLLARVELCFRRWKECNNIKCRTLIQSILLNSLEVVFLLVKNDNKKILYWGNIILEMLSMQLCVQPNNTQLKEKYADMQARLACVDKTQQMQRITNILQEYQNAELNICLKSHVFTFKDELAYKIFLEILQKSKISYAETASLQLQLDLKEIDPSHLKTVLMLFNENFNLARSPSNGAKVPDLPTNEVGCSTPAALKKRAQNAKRRAKKKAAKAKAAAALADQPSTSGSNDIIADEPKIVWNDDPEHPDQIKNYDRLNTNNPRLITVSCFAPNVFDGLSAEYETKAREIARGGNVLGKETRRGGQGHCFFKHDGNKALKSLVNEGYKCKLKIQSNHGLGDIRLVAKQIRMGFFISNGQRIQIECLLYDKIVPKAHA